MYNLIRANLFQLRKSMAIKILFAITTVSSFIMVVMAFLIPQGKIDDSMTGIGFLFSDINMISILGAALAGVFICGDFDNKIIHDAIANGYSRVTVIVSKAIVFCCGVAFLLIPYAMIICIALSSGSKFSMGKVDVGFLHILTNESGIAFSALDICRLLIIMLTLIIIYASQLSVCVPLAFVLKKPVFVVAIYYMFTIFCGQLAGLRGSSIVFDDIFDCTPFGGNYTFITLDSPVGDIIKAISVSLIFTTVMITVTYFAFRKSEIK